MNFDKNILVIILIVVIAVLGGLLWQSNQGAEQNNEVEQENVQSQEQEDAEVIENNFEEQQFITLLSPNGGEKWKIGDSCKIKWDSYGITKVKIFIIDYRAPEHCALNNKNFIFSDSGKYSFKLESCIVHNMGTDNMVMLSPENEYKVKIEGYKDGKVYRDESDNYFSIVE